MYQKTQNAAVWIGAENTTPQPRAERARSTTLWASKPLKTVRGVCVAVRCVNDSRVLVGLRQAGRIEWVLAERVLQPGDLERWMRSGFAARADRQDDRRAG